MQTSDINVSTESWSEITNLGETTVIQLKRGAVQIVLSATQPVENGIGFVLAINRVEALKMDLGESDKVWVRALQEDSKIVALVA